MGSSCHICSTPQSRFYEFVSSVSLISIEKSGDYLVLAEINHMYSLACLRFSGNSTLSNPTKMWDDFIIWASVGWWHFAKYCLTMFYLDSIYLTDSEIEAGLGNLPVSLFGSKALLFALVSIFCLDWDTDTLLICFLPLGYIQFYQYSLEWGLITSACQGVPGRCLLNSGFANSSGSLGICTSE